jgi:hypothetical protein
LHWSLEQSTRRIIQHTAAWREPRSGRPKRGASSLELLRYLFTNPPRQIIVVDYAPRLVVDYHMTGKFRAAAGPAVMGDVLNFQPSHNLEKNEQAKENQINLNTAPGDKAPRSAPHLFHGLIMVWQSGVPYAHPVMPCNGHEVRRRGSFQTRSGQRITASLHFAFANELRHCRGEGATDLRNRGLRPDTCSWRRNCSRAARPTSGCEPAPRPPVAATPIWMIRGQGLGICVGYNEIDALD